MVNRRGFLGFGELAVIGVTVVPVTALTMALADLHAQTFSVLGADVGKTPIRIAGQWDAGLAVEQAR